MRGFPEAVAVGCRALLALALTSVAVAARAEVVDAAAEGFTVRSSVEIGSPATEVWRSLVEEVGVWWDPAHTFSGEAGAMELEATPGGCLCERWQGEGGVVHLSVVNVAPPRLLVLTGGLGPLQSEAVAGGLVIDVTESGRGVTVTLTYRVGGYVPAGLDAWAGAVDGVLTNQMVRLKRFVETGSPEVESSN